MNDTDCDKQMKIQSILSQRRVEGKHDQKMKRNRKIDSTWKRPPR